MHNGQQGNTHPWNSIEIIVESASIPWCRVCCFVWFCSCSLLCKWLCLTFCCVLIACSNLTQLSKCSWSAQVVMIDGLTGRIICFQVSVYSSILVYILFKYYRHLVEVIPVF